MIQFIHFMLITLSASLTSGLGIPYHRSLNSADPSGDSYSLTGFNASIDPQPSVDNPLGNPPYPGERLSGGKMWLDIVMADYVPNGTVAYDFAAGGNTVNLTLIEPDRVRDPYRAEDLGEQVDEFEKISPPWKGDNSLFINWFGINDIAGPVIFHQKDLDETEAIARPSVQDYFGLLERQYQLGARKFLTVLVPPIYRTPVCDDGNADIAVTIQNATSYLNDLIREGNTEFLGRHTLVESAIIDSSPTFNNILDNPEQYGAANSTCLNYPKGEPCLWHDFIHPGIVIQREFGKQIGSLIRTLIL